MKSVRANPNAAGSPSRTPLPVASIGIDAMRAGGAAADDRAGRGGRGLPDGPRQTVQQTQPDRAENGCHEDEEVGHLDAIRNMDGASGETAGDDGRRIRTVLRADESEGPRLPRPLVSTPLEASILRGREIGMVLADERHEPSSARLRDLGIDPQMHPDLRSDELISMATVITAEDSGSLNTFSGGLAHECGWYPSAKNHRVQHWHGISARRFIVEAECNRTVDRYQSEGVRFRFYLASKWRSYTADVDMRVNGVRHVVEVKARERDLRGAEYRLVLAAVAEICRRCGWVFRIVLGHEIFANALHGDNAELFSSRRFVRISKRTIDRLEGFAVRRGAATSYGELAAALAPQCVEVGEALIQALTIQGRIDIDLTSRIYHRTPLTIT
jgi:hypothetical protein